MYYPTTGTSAYKPQFDRQTAGQKRSQVKKRVSKMAKKASRTRGLIVVAVIFAIAFTYLGRYVYIFGQHDKIANMTKELENIKMANDQLSVEIKTLTDSSRIEQYAIENLNLKKMDSNQIIYLDQTTSDNMQRMTKEKENILNGIFGLFSGIVEYLN